MEQEEILSNINARLNSEGANIRGFERTVTDYISRNLPVEGTEPDDAYFNTHVGVIKSLYGNFCHDVANTVKQRVDDFKKNYKPQPAPPANPPAGEDDTQKALLERIAALEKKSQEAERKNLSDSLRRKISGMSKSLNVANSNLWKDCVDSIAIEEGDTAESLTTKVKKAYEKKLKDYFGEGAAPYNGGGSPAGPADSAEAKKRREAFKSRMKSRGRL